MESGYSVETIEKLEQKFKAEALHRPRRINRYEPGAELTYKITDVATAVQGTIRLKIEKFVGGGFAGQVYKVRLIDIQSENNAIDSLEPGKIYAIKILIPPANFSRLFRNILYWLGFQGPFQLQVNPAAARSGAIWQKFIRRAANKFFGNERAVVDIYATFVDHTLGSCGEISQWVDGRTWRLEVNEYLDVLKKWRKGKRVKKELLGSPEYRAKHEFMTQFVALLHQIGAHEFARQYEWSTCKSQPNCLKWNDTNDNPEEGLVAVDFRAGLALLPILPMSPGDFKLIWQGIIRGSLVQFDRGDLKKLEKFIADHPDDFTGMQSMLVELKQAEQVYRNSVPDITHNHVKLLFSGRLWSTIFNSAVTGWRVRNLIDERWEQRLRNNKFLTFLFWLLGALPFLGSFVRKCWGQPFWRKHYRNMVTHFNYFKKSLRGKAFEKIINWHRSGRTSVEKSGILARQVWRLSYHVPLSILPVGLHRFFTDGKYAKERLDFLLLRPFRLYFDADLRTQWLKDMVSDGKKKNLLSQQDADTILAQVGEPFIQKYLKSLAVHLATLPVTQIVSILLAGIYIMMHPDMPRAQAYGIGLGIIALFQVVPISPGSLVRGLYVLYLVIKEKNFKDYNIAVFLGFFKYIGYLAFPIQMAYRYPALARFMAGHWATEAVHIVPVFGEGGALLEHWVFDLFYNWPLTIRRRMRKVAEIRAGLRPRYWHVGLYSIIGAGIFIFTETTYLNHVGELPNLRDVWWLTIALPLVFGSLVTLGAGGAVMGNRIISSVLCGIFIGILTTITTVLLHGSDQIGFFVTNLLWRIFIFGTLGSIGALLTEVKLPDPEIQKF